MSCRRGRDGGQNADREVVHAEIDCLQLDRHDRVAFPIARRATMLPMVSVAP